MKQRVHQHWPLVLALLALAAGAACLLAVIDAWGAGPFVYSLDDPYIHLAMAKNIAQHGVYGVTRYEFSSSSSSPAWTLLLAAAVSLFGPATWLPLALNLACAAAAVCAANAILVRHVAPRHGRAAASRLAFALLALLALAPIPPLAFTGMEHTLQIALALPFAYLAARAAGDDPPRRGWPLYALAPVLVLVRFEGLFLIAGAAGLLCFRKRWRRAALLVALGAAPVGLYALFSLAHGSLALPNSVLLKGMVPTGALAFPRGALIIIGQAALRWLRSPYLLFEIALAAALCIRRPRALPAWDVRLNLLAITVIAALLHVTFAQTGGFNRYEAYLMALGVLGIALAVDACLPAAAPRRAAGWRLRAASGLFFACLVALPTAYPRAARSFTQTPQAARNIYEQQVQVARFVAQYYGGSAVAANDIGALDYLADVHLLDLGGLGNVEVAAAASNGAYTTAAIRAFARERGVAVAVLYPTWFRDPYTLPPEWVKAGEWTIRNNVVCGSDTVAFYAVDPAAYAGLVRNLAAFDASLPPTVARRGAYLDAQAAAPRGE